MNVVIVGANRGIGFELAKTFSARHANVTATFRGDPASLTSLDCKQIGDFDTTRFSDDDATKFPASIDVLIVNAGILQADSFASVELDSVSRQLNVNAIGPLRVVRALRDRLTEGAKVILITSRMGSIADNSSGGYYGYRLSKAALNAAGKSLAIDLKESGVSVALVHPGYVKTDMTGHNGHISAEQSATMIASIIDSLTLSTSGSFLHADGTTLPW